MTRNSVKEVWNEKESKETKEGHLRFQLFVISTHWGVVLSFPLLFSGFFSRFIPRFMLPLLPVHLEKASHLSALYSAAAPARALASIMF